MKILNRNQTTTDDYNLTEDPYVITPVFNQGISKITFHENQRSSINANSIKIYTSTNGGQSWSTAAIASAAKSSKFDLITVTIEGININRLKIAKPATVTMNIDNLTIYAPIGTTLPLDFVSFTASLKKSFANKTLLQWKTANEVNTASFEIQRSANGNDFYKIGEQPAVNRSGSQVYEFEDLQPLVGVNYYRLKQIDLDGKFKYSELRTVNNRIDGSLVLYPNPVVKELLLNHPEAAVGTTVSIYDISGRQVVAKSIAKGDIQTSVSLDHLPRGIYLLKYKTAGEVISQKIIKQ